MKNNLLFDFTVDKTSNTVLVNREFDADLSLVWDAFTKQEILDQWWAPEPWKAKTKFMNFEVGGRRFRRTPLVKNFLFGKSIPHHRKTGSKFSVYENRFCCFVNGKIE